MKFEDLSPEEQELVNTDFPAEMEKEAMDKVAMSQELYSTGMNKLAADTAKEMDEAEEESKEEKPEDKLDEGEKKEAQVRGAFIARGYIDGLMKQGADNHGDELHYLYPFVAEKIAMKMPNVKGGTEKAMKYLKEKGGKGGEKAKAGAGKVQEFLSKHRGKASGAAGAAGGFVAGRASKD